MKKLAILITAALSALVPLSSTFACVNELGDESVNCILEETAGDIDESLVEEKTSSDMRFQADETLETKGEWKSSVFFAGNNVKDESLVSGIGLLAGNLVDIAGIYDYGLVAGNNVDINGEYKNDAFLLGNMIDITKDAKLGRDLYAAGNEVTISTSVNGSAYIVANKIILEDIEIKGDLVVSAPIIEVNGKVNVVGLFKRNNDALVSGEITYGMEEVYENKIDDIEVEYSFKDQLISAVFSLACSIATAVVFALIGKKFFIVCHEKTKTYEFVDGIADFGIGLLALVVTPIAMIFIMLTIVGFPAALILLLAYIIMVCLSSIVFAEWLGEKVLKKHGAIINAIFGLVVLTIVELIPVIGPIISFVAMGMGLGLMLRVFFRKKNVI